MRITLRLIVSLITAVVLVAMVSAYFNVRQEREKLYTETRGHMALLAESFSETVRSSLASKNYCMSFDLFVDFVLKPLDTFPAASA